MLSPTPILLLASALIAGPLASGRQSSASGASEQRPVILIVHGRGQLGRDTTSLRVELQRSLEAGLKLPVADSLFRDGDVRLVWYADVLDPRSEEGCRYHESNPRSRERWERRGGAQSFWDLARGVIGMAAASLDSAGADGARGVLGDLMYAADLWKRCGAERRVADALDQAARESRPVILVSHSFGAIVTYGYLEGYKPADSRTPVEVRRWVTIGSVLGVPAVRQLLLGDSRTSLPRPAAVRSWLNVRDPDDALSARVTEDGGPSNAMEVETTVGGVLAHELYSYLRDRKAASSVVAAWCAAFPGRDAAPAWCVQVPDVTSPAAGR